MMTRPSMAARTPTTRLGVVALSTFLAFSTLHHTAGAAPPPSSTKVADSLSGDAKDAFNRARLAFSKGDYAAAREQYEQAFELSKEPRVLYNVAVCLKEQGRYAAAIRVLQRSADSVKNAPKDYVERLADTIDTLLALVAVVTVEGIEEGMKVEVDGEAVPVDVQGKLLVDAGTRKIAVRKNGFAPQSFTRDFPASEKYAFRVALTPLPGRLRVAALGSRDASVLLDGREVGLAPVSLDLAPGMHEIVVRAPGFRDVRRSIDVKQEDETAVEIALDRDERMARLRVTAGEKDAIAVDGRATGLRSFDGTLAVGEHRVTISRPDAETETIELALREGEVRDMRVTLREKSGRGLPAWVWAVGGAVVLGGASTAIYFAARPTEFEGSAPGTLTPRVVPAAFDRGGLR